MIRGLFVAAVFAALATAAPGVWAEPSPDDAMRSAMERVPPADRPLSVRLPSPRPFRLDNGLLLLVLEDRRLPTVTMTMRVRAGSFYEPDDRRGLAALTAATLDEGTESRTGAELARQVDAMGASLSADAEQGGPVATVHIEGLSQDTAILLDLLADVVRRPSFPAGPFDKVKRQMTASLVQAARDPAAIAEETALEALYGDTPPARVRPPISHIEALAPDDLKAFHKDFYRPERAILGVAGDVEADAVARLVRRAFGDWERGTRQLQPDLPKYGPAPETRVLLVDRPGSVQAVLRLANLGITRNSPDYPALVVMNHILGGSFTSRLWANIRESKGYAYDVHSDFTAPRYTGYWYAGAEVRNAVTGDALAQFLAEFERLREEKVSPEELAGARQGIIGTFARELEDPNRLLDKALDVVQFGLPEDYWSKFPQRIQDVDDGDVRRVARRYLVNPQIVAVGERSEIEAALKKVGPVTIVTPDAPDTVKPPDGETGDPPR